MTRVAANKSQLSQAVLTASLAVIGVRLGAAQTQNNPFTGHQHSNSCATALGSGNTQVFEDDHAVTTDVTVMSSSVPGHSTYRVSLILHDEVENVYSIYGDQGRDMVFPPAYQVASPFGTDFGGVNPILFAPNAMPSAQFDSWLTVGISEGDSLHKLGQVGIEFAIWDEFNGLVSAPDTGGSVFWMNPDEVRYHVRGSCSAFLSCQRELAHCRLELSLQ